MRADDDGALDPEAVCDAVALVDCRNGVGAERGERREAGLGALHATLHTPSAAAAALSMTVAGSVGGYDWEGDKRAWVVTKL